MGYKEQGKFEDSGSSEFPNTCYFDTKDHYQRGYFAKGKYYIPGNTLGSGLPLNNMARRVMRRVPHHGKR